MFSTKLKTIKDCLNISKWGNDYRSKKVLIYVDLLNHLGFKRKYLRNKIAASLEKEASNGEIIIDLKIDSTINFPAKLRLHDYCDYQGVGECLGGMYSVNAGKIKYIIDAGGNLGFFSISMMKRSSVKEAIVIEPNPYNLELLNYNLQKFKNITVLPIAISNVKGKFVFQLEGGTNSGSLNLEDSKILKNSVNVTCEKLSALIPSHWNIKETLLKIDIEGAEYDVLPEIFDNQYFPPIILGEIHDYLNKGGEQLVELLKKHRYKVHVTGKGNSGIVCRQFSALREI